MIFITGATSFVGRNLLEELEKRKIESICLIRKKEDEELFKHLKLVKWVIGDLNSREIIKKYLNEKTTCIHLANITDEYSPHIFFINVEGTRKIIEICKQKRIKNFIYLGSANISKKRKNAYDSSKFLCEVILKKSGLNYTIIHPSVIYGKYDKKNIFNYIMNLKKLRFKIFMEVGRNIQPVYVKDVIQLIIKNIEHLGKKIVFITTPPITKQEYLETIIKTFKLKLHYLLIPKIKKRDMEIIPYVEKELEKELGKKPYLFKEGLLEYYNENFNFKRTN